jgi:hypothetical protein
VNGERLENTLFYLIGFAGVSKYTVAKALAALTGARVVDNHTINNPIFGLIEQEGVKPLPPEIFDPKHPNTLTLDTTTRSPAAAAERILEHARFILGRGQTSRPRQAGATA